MAINFSGEFSTPRTPEEVFDFLSDPNRFGPLLPDFQSMSMQDPTHFTVKVKVGVGNIRGSAELKMELSEAVKPVRAQYKGQGTAVGSQVTVNAGFDLTALPEGTKVVWQGETGVFGKLASMAGGMLEPLGRKNIQKLIEGLQKVLSEPAVQAPAAASAASLTPTGPDIVGVPQSGMPVETPGLSPAAADPLPVAVGVAVEAPSHGPANSGFHEQATAWAAQEEPNPPEKKETSTSNTSPQGGTNVAQDGVPGSGSSL